MDTSAVKLLIESHGFIASLHQLGDDVETNAFTKDAVDNLDDGVGVPNNLKVARVEGNGIHTVLV